MSKRILAIFVLLLFFSDGTALTALGLKPRSDLRISIDMAGRTVIVPKKITRVMGISPHP